MISLFCGRQVDSNGHVIAAHGFGRSTLVRSDSGGESVGARRRRVGVAGDLVDGVEERTCVVSVQNEQTPMIFVADLTVLRHLFKELVPRSTFALIRC